MMRQVRAGGRVMGRGKRKLGRRFEPLDKGLKSLAFAKLCHARGPFIGCGGVVIGNFVILVILLGSLVGGKECL